MVKMKDLINKFQVPIKLPRQLDSLEFDSELGDYGEYEYGVEEVVFKGESVSYENVKTEYYITIKHQLLDEDKVSFVKECVENKNIPSDTDFDVDEIMKYLLKDIIIFLVKQDNISHFITYNIFGKVNKIG